MTARVYTIASGKGGTGKTTATLNLGTALAMLGKKTMVLDADIGMANLGLLIGLEKSKITLHEVLSGSASINEAIYEGPAGLRVIPSGLSLRGFQNSDPDRLKEVMASAIDGIEFLLIDAPAGISKDGVIPLAVADKVILVVNPELSSMADALKTKALTEMLGRSVEGIILNRAELEKTEINSNKVSELLGAKLLEIIPEDANIRRSAAFKTPIVIRAPKSPAAIAFSRLAAQMAGTKFQENNSKEEKESFVDRLARSIFGGK
ncbi:cell division ATPase MinD, archaeal [Candidatus Methanoperedens nitroreducens]|uniref:Cell division ATPase MinD, archaeal n=1 Tax=Candidatus Methanoperedens nitratireducens TaxID=1392998 RepID=A0A062V5I8_9EURY|nr:cell division ATPase MinD [Candidatus Methanoperedens nitroreducens]KCZ72587.1 cell division ATPase MinD, archaeal [Candidatus Methanoperedens nitroreducens]MDJ1423481.1 cell division ATPase MinD [Candidatus Methanoperedens sp.]